MLEEALRNEKGNPAETALAVLSFLESELPAGGSAAESRFFNLYGTLCERIFGPILGEEDNFRHKDGGWLSSRNQWTRPITPAEVTPRSPLGTQIASTKASLSRTPSNNLDGDPVVKLLGAAKSKDILAIPSPNLLEALTSQSENSPGVVFAFQFQALPKSFQASWLSVVEASMGGRAADCSANTSRLLMTLLHKRPDMQSELRRYKLKTSQQQRPDNAHQPLHLSPRGTNTAATLSSNVSPSSLKTSYSAANGSPKAPPPTVLLSMLEYYLFLFLRFPLATPSRKDPTSSTKSSIPGVHIHRIPMQVPNQNGLLRRQSREGYGHVLYHHIFRRCVRHFLPYVQESERWIDFSNCLQSELFVRIVIAMWFEFQPPLVATSTTALAIQERQRFAGTTHAPEDSQLSFSYDYVQITSQFLAVPSQIQRCSRMLLVHALLDPCVKKKLNEPTWCLTTFMSGLQLPLYNYTRTVFRYATIHSTESPFFGALDSWLIWLEPWNVIESRSVEFSAKEATERLKSAVSGSGRTRGASTSSLSIPRANQQNKYSAMWEPYIAANVYMYAIPLAMFLRRARELDFSAGKFDRSIEIVRRVFRVFSPQVVDAISRHLGSNGESKMIGLVAQHSKNLGLHAPPAGPMALSSLKPDMQSLVEEIDMQHSKKVLELDIVDRMVRRVEGFFGGGVISGESKALVDVMARAKVIVGLPADSDMLHSNRSTSVSNSTAGDASPSECPLWKEDGSLSTYGREQIVLGTVKCSPLDIRDHDDKMRARAGSYEIPILVELTIWASDAVNTFLGFSLDHGGRFRINLRFFADYRNSAFVLVVAYFLVHLL